MEKLKFYVNEELRFVVASAFAEVEYCDNRKFRAVAKCNVGDEFNEQLGKKLALARLKYKIERARLKVEEKKIQDRVKRWLVPQQLKHDNALKQLMDITKELQ